MQLPATLPDETLFSRYVRHMTILGIHENDYLKLLFNRSRVSIHPYITIGITKASKISKEDELTIFKHQTLGRFFAYFTSHKSNDIYQGMLGDNGNIAFRATQLVSFRESEVLSLKYCPLCAQEDIMCHGVSYWHLIHQVPGVEACPNHQAWLIHQELPARPHLKPGLLPDPSISFKKSSELSHKFAKFTRTLLTVITRDNSYYDRKNLIEKVKRGGYLLGENSFKIAEMTSDLFNSTNDLTHDKEGFLPYSVNDYKYISYLLSGHVSQHPFKYLLVNFFHENIKDFDSTNCTTPVKKSKLIKNETIEKQCVILLKQHKSLAEISRLIGKSRCYVKSVAMKRNISYLKKPFILTDEIIKRIITLAYKGFHRKAIARNFHISTGSVEQIISSEPGLVEKRRRYKFEAKRRRYKAQILRTLKQQPLAIKQEIKKACYAAFYWLYAHEKAWLNLTLPSPTKPIVRSKVNWEKRDIELAPQVSNIMHNINGAISRAELDKAIGGHGWLIRMKHKLPITMNIIKQLQK